MSKLPETILHPANFLSSPAAGYDGVFHWEWVNKAFSDTRITAMDWDGVVERRGQFLVIETKDEGREPPEGQLITLRSAHALGCFCIMLVWGKGSPTRCEIWYPGTDRKETRDCDADYLTNRVLAWRRWAEKNPRSLIDVSFLNRRVAILANELEQARYHASALVSVLGGSVSWRCED